MLANNSPKLCWHIRLKPTEYKPGINGRLKCLRKQPQEKQTGELLATIHAHMDCLIMYVSIVGEICVFKWCACKTPSCKSGHIY